MGHVEPSSQKYVPPRARADSPRFEGTGGGYSNSSRYRDHKDTGRKDDGYGRRDDRDGYARRDDRDSHNRYERQGSSFNSYRRDRDREYDRDGPPPPRSSPAPSSRGSDRPFSPSGVSDHCEGSEAHPHLRQIDRLKHEEIQPSKLLPRVSSLGSVPTADKPSTMPRVASHGSLPEPTGRASPSIPRVGSSEVLRDIDESSSSGFGRSSPTPRGRFSSTPVPVVWRHWEPVEAVKQMSEDQVKKIREAMMITVSGSPPIANPCQRFDELNLDSRIIADIAAHQYIRPTPIQAQALPVALTSRHILGFAETGSGKTAAFCIPMISHILHQDPLGSRDGPIGLVLAPTRELAQQIDKEAKMFSISSNIRGTIVVGGSENMQQQRSDLRAGVEYVVATPGRFIQHLQQGNTSLNRCSFLVLDEADRMLDMGFEDQIREIIGRISRDRQTLLFSATMPEEIEDLAREYLDNPVRISIGTVNKPTANVEQHLDFVPEDRKMQRLIDIIREDEESAEAFHRDQPQILVFVETKIKCEELCSTLRSKGMQCDRLHADRTQPQREAALQAYRDGQINVLLATDLASRGLDVLGITHVINYDLPKKMEDYVHRIGRTGRAGQSGKATSFYDERDTDVVVHIRRAINDASGNNSRPGDSPALFAAGKAARRREKAEKEIEKQKRKEIEENLSTISIDEKYRHMLIQPVRDDSAPAPASDAWDD